MDFDFKYDSFLNFQMDHCKQIIVIGCMEFSDMRHHVHVIGHAGMELLPNNCVLVDFCTMNMLIHVIGLKMLMDAKNIVSENTIEKIFKPKSN